MKTRSKCETRIKFCQQLSDDYTVGLGLTTYRSQMAKILLCFSLFFCKQASDVKVSARDDQRQMIDALANKIIGHYPREFDSYKQELQKLGPYTPETASKHYRQVLEKILNSESYYNYGFFHLHSQRLLLQEPSDRQMANHYQTLRLEMADLAKSNNYWDMLRYQGRWLKLKPQFDCKDMLKKWFKEPTEPTEPTDCSYFLYDKFVSYSSKQCNNENQDAIFTQFKEKYKDLFEDSLCNIKNNEEKDVVTKIELNLKDAFSLYISMKLSSGLEELYDFTVSNYTEVDSSSFIKITFPPELGVRGIHANPYWLSKHVTSIGNQHLHRARIIWHSWFCSSISPDEAVETNRKPSNDELTRASQYFAENDTHAKGDRNCFGCHRMIQPIANFFGKMRMDKTVAGHSININEYLLTDDRAFARPGAYYNPKDDSFITVGNGLEGLANVLQPLPRVHRCLVNSTWNTIFGSKWSLTSDEVNTAVKVFADSGFNYRQLLTHLLTKEKAIKYFTVSHNKFYDMVIAEKPQTSCNKITTSLNAQDIIKETCANSCHIQPYSDAFNDPESLTGEQLKQIYPRIINNDESVMPPDDGYWQHEEEATPEEQRQIVKCYLQDKAKLLGVTLLESNNPIATDTIHEMKND